MIEDAVVMVRLVTVVRLTRMMMVTVRMRQVAMVVLMVMGVANTVSMRPFFLTVSVRQEPHRAHRRQGDDDRQHADRVEPPNSHAI